MALTQPNNGMLAISMFPAAAGLKMTNGATPSTQIAISAYAVAMATAGGQTVYASSVSVTVDLTTGTFTSTPNGMDGEARGTTAGTPLYLYLISNGTTTGGLCTRTSPLSGSPTMPTGYTYKFYCGAMLIDGSGNLYRTIQYGRRTQYQVTATTNTAALPFLATGAAGSLTTPTWIAVPVSPYVPPTAGSVKIGISIGGTNNTSVQAAPNNSYGVYNSTTNPPALLCQSSSNGGTMAYGELVLESTNIYWASGPSTGLLVCLGWEDYVVAA